MILTNTQCCFPGHTKHGKAHFFRVHDGHIIHYGGLDHFAETLPVGLYICRSGVEMGLESGLIKHVVCIPDELQ